MVKGIEMGLLDKDLDPRYETFVLLCQDIQCGCEGLPDFQISVLARHPDTACSL